MVTASAHHGRYEVILFIQGLRELRSPYGKRGTGKRLVFSSYEPEQEEAADIFSKFPALSAGRDMIWYYGFKSCP